MPEPWHPFDVTDANQEVQRRLENLHSLQNEVQKKNKSNLTLFLWKENNPLNLTRYGHLLIFQETTADDPLSSNLGTDKQQCHSMAPRSRARPIGSGAE